MDFRIFKSMDSTGPHIRFREARERCGLSISEVSCRCGFTWSESSIWDVEAYAGELSSCYSPVELQQLCAAINIRPIELFGDDFTEPSVSTEELVRLIEAECASRKITLLQFEEVVGWRLSACIQPPQRLLEDISLDGLQWLCRELHIDWRRVLLALTGENPKPAENSI